MYEYRKTVKFDFDLENNVITVKQKIGNRTFRCKGFIYEMIDDDIKFNTRFKERLRHWLYNSVHFTFRICNRFLFMIKATILKSLGYKIKGRIL